MSHMGQFVHRQNGVPQCDGANDTKPSKRKSKDPLKVPVTHPTSGHVNQHGASTRSHSRSKAERDSVASGPLFDTDASNADRTSGAETEQFLNQGAEPQTAYERQDTPPQQVFKDRRISGDSYPPTTSGHPSEVDGVDAHHSQHPTGPHAQSMQAFQPSLTHAGQARARGATHGMTAPSAVHDHSSTNAQIAAIASQYSFPKGPSRTPATQGIQHVPHAQPHQPQQPPQQLDRAQAHPNGKQHQQRQHAPPVQPAAQQPQHDQSAGMQLNATTAPHGPAVDMRVYANRLDEHGPRRARGVPLDNVTNQQRGPEVRQPRPSPVSEHLVHNNGTHYQQHARSDMPAGSDELHSESRSQQGLDDGNLQDIAEGQPAQLSQAQPLSREPSPELDVMPPELFKMDYTDLKGRSFDVDPNARPFDLPQTKSTHTLQDQLEAVMPLESQAQVNFLTNLSAEQWEDAGDWFTDRFSDLVRKLKDFRKEKRKAARAFEDEVERRHDAITKKQKLTESALREMKENGGKVLQGTPKKSHQTKK